MKKLLPIALTTILFLFACNNPKVQLINEKASLPESFKFDQMGLKVMASFINKKTESMSVLYANSVALSNAVKGDNSSIPGGVLALITWKKQDDEHWFGAGIPGALLSVEIVKTTNGGKDASIDYNKYIGKDLLPARDTLGQNARINYIIDQHPSIMP